jgi:hypothetical protein
LPIDCLTGCVACIQPFGENPEFFGSVKIVRYLHRLIIEWFACRVSALMRLSSMRLLAGAAIDTFQGSCETFRGSLPRTPLHAFVSNSRMYRAFREHSSGLSYAPAYIDNSSYTHRRFSQTVSDFQWMSRIARYASHPRWMRSIAYDAHHSQLSHRTPPWTIVHPREEVRTSRWRRYLPPNHDGAIV